MTTFDYLVGNTEKEWSVNQEPNGFAFFIKGHKCPFYAKDGMGILESPNFPGEYPAGAECHWRVRPNRNRRVLVIISSIHLDDSCGDVLTIRKTGTYQ